jgi:signal transduction histidine kinase
MPQESVLDDLVHELRQPLSVIESVAYLLEMTSKDAKFSPHLQQIQAMVRQASHILDRAKEH